MAPNTENVENPFGLAQLWAESGVVIKATLVILIIMSLASWYVILTKLWDQRRVRKAYKEVEKNFWVAGNLRDGISKLSGKDNAFRMIAEDGVRAAQHHEGRLTDQIPLHEWSEGGEDAVDSAPGAEEHYAARQAAGTLWQEVAALPIVQQQVLVYRFVRDMSIREIADTMGRTEGAVKQLLFRAVKRLRQRLLHIGFDHEP